MRIRLNKSIRSEFEQTAKNALGNIEFEVKYKFGAVIAYVCPHCGVELLGHWKECRVSYKNENDKKLILDYNRKCQRHLEILFSEEVSITKKLKECPLCGGKLSKDRGYYIEVCQLSLYDVYGLKYNDLANNELAKIYTFSDSLHAKI